jgi:NAD(P)H-hydrate repair Nnr-like enzyme with NAD(P)H-hydrate epimerase domain
VTIEIAGRNAAEVVRKFYAPLRRVVIFTGTRSNGDILVVSRHLANAGVPVRAHLCGERARLKPDAATEFTIVKRIEIDVTALMTDAAARAAAVEFTDGDISAYTPFGTAFDGTTCAPVSTLIEALNGARATLALDVP